MKKRILLFFLTAALATTALIGCGNSDDQSSGSGDEITFTYWMPIGEQSTHYLEYEDNPIAQYITSKYTFGGKQVNVDYYVPPTGSESENFNNLLATGEYTQVIDMAMSSVSAAEMYQDEMIYDLTELASEYMPNYMAFISEHPELEENLYTIVDGEKKILSLTSFSDGVSPSFAGFAYRRDWIAKYGTNPTTGEAFTYGFTDESDFESWEDNVVFPNGTDEPMYISDWEWMFEIFDLALSDLGITDGYGYAPYYTGFLSTGDLVSAFGGDANAYWYRSAEDDVVFGPQTDNFRAYLQCMNTWYEKGWVDSAFAEHNTDMFFSVDAAKVYTGKVGLWYGLQSTLGTQIDDNSAYTDGAVVFGCRQPINDIYGGAESQNAIPRTMYQQTQVVGNIVITDKVAESDLPVLLEYLDFMYTEEGLALRIGFTKEKYEETQDEFYTKWEITEGLYRIEEEDGEEIIKYNIDASDPVLNAAAFNRPFNLTKVENVDYGYDRYVDQAVEAWDYYLAYPLFSTAVTNAISAEDTQAAGKIRTNVDDYMAREISAIIKGNDYDVWDDASWGQFCTDIGKYQPEKVTAIFQEAVDLITQ